MFRFIYLVGIYATTGLVWGFLNVASMQMILTIWDSAKSRPIVQISLMVFSLGALTTSSSCRYFLSGDAELKCGGEEEAVELDSFNPQPLSNTSENTVAVDNSTLEFYEQVEFWPYTINALMHLVFGVILLASTAFNKNEQGQSSIIRQKRPEKTINEIWLYGKCQVSLFHFLHLSIRIVLHNVPCWHGLRPRLSFPDLDIFILRSNANDNRKRTWVSF